MVSSKPRKPSNNAVVRLSASEARQIALKAQGLWSRNLTSLNQMSSTLGAVQLDTISVLARSHELIPYARLGAITRAEIENHYWSQRTATHFEYWSHAACIIPVANWPLYGFRRQHHQQNPPRWHDLTRKQLNSMLKRIEAEGPISTSEVGGGRKSSYWWDWSDNKSALENLLLTGEVTVTKRVGFKRLYDVSSRAIPNRYFKDAEAEDSKLQLLTQSLNMLGVATKADILDVPHLKPAELKTIWGAFLEHAIQVEVEGWQEPAFTTSSWLKQIKDEQAQLKVLLSPFDSLVWYRPRMERLFGMFYPSGEKNLRILRDARARRRRISGTGGSRS